METIVSADFKDRETREHLDGTVTEYSYFAPLPELMDNLLKVLFEKHWRDVGTQIELYS